MYAEPDVWSAPMSEAEAKAAWLAKFDDEPSWKGVVTPTGGSSAEAWMSEPTAVGAFSASMSETEAKAAWLAKLDR